ncbi:MAG: hypothetical protein IKU07_06020 [Oscillospiraceae bacterium]|nr:hypothetical protein [Oscillospiraceae bacterium]
MGCLKCGRELSEGQSFCDSCRQDMAQYPIKQDAPVHIIPRPVEPVEKKPSRKEKPSEQALHDHLRSAIRWLVVAVGILTMVACLLAALLLNGMNEPPEPDIGRNYTVITTDQ